MIKTIINFLYKTFSTTKYNTDQSFEFYMTILYFSGYSYISINKKTGKYFFSVDYNRKWEDHSDRRKMSVRIV